MKKLYSLLFIISAGLGFVLPLPSAYPQLSISGSHADRSQTHWSGVGNDLINAGSPAILSVTTEPSGQQAAITNGHTAATTGGIIMYNDVASYSITYTLDTSVHTLGYDLTSIDSYTGWTQWRVNQIYDVTYTTVGSATPLPLASVAYQPIVDGYPSLTNVSHRVHITDVGGVLARGVKTITFTFKGDTTQPSSGLSHVGAVYREIDIGGRPTEPAVNRTIMNSGSSSYVIATADTPTVGVTTAAAQLQDYLQQIGGGAIPIVGASSVAPSVPRILIGRSSEVDALLPGMDWTPLVPDGFVMKTVGNDIILAGGGDRGTLYAVFDFLERQLGCRWWASGEQDITAATTITVPNLYFVEAPAFQYRSHFTRDAIADPVFATIMRQNGTYQQQIAAWGGHHEILGPVHTHFLLVPPSVHFASHPEWYTDPVTGLPCTSASPMPTSANSQLNLAAPGLVAAVAAEALAWITANPDAGYISITENDNGNYCRCSSCVALRSVEGSQAGPNLHFVNQVAAIIHASSDFKVETLAYRNTVAPPATITPAAGVAVRFAPLQSDFGHPLNSEWNGPTPLGSLAGYYQENAYDNLPDWADISGELLVWNYITNFTYTMLPFPNIQLLGEDLRFFAQNKVTGIFEQGDNYTGGVGDFVQLRTWVVSKMMWNPLMDQDVYIDEFLSGYYGAAAPYLRDYIDLVRESYLATGRELLADEADFIFMDLATMTAGKAFFDQAEAAVTSDPVKLARVQRERISFDLMWLYRYNPLRQAANFTSQTFGGPSAPLTALGSLGAAATGFGVDQFQENSEGFGSFTLYEAPRLQAKLTANLTADQTAALPASILALIPSGTEKENLIVLHPHDLKIRVPRLGEVVADSLSPSGFAVSMRGELVEWGPQYEMSRYEEAFYNDDTWNMYVEVRVDAGLSAAGNAFELGVYDIPQYLALGTGNVFYQQVPFSTLSDGQYHLVSVGSGGKKIPKTSFLWITGGNPSIPYIYVNRIFFVRN